MSNRFQSARRILRKGLETRPMKLLNTLAYKVIKLYWRLTGPLTMGVRVLAVKNDAVLLIKPTYQKYWYFPGGGVKKRESVTDAARRETREEAGAVLGDPLVLMGVYTSFDEGKSDHVALFLSRNFEMNGKRFSTLEIEKCAFFPLDRAMNDKSVSPATRRRLREFMDWDGTVKMGGW